MSDMEAEVEEVSFLPGPQMTEGGLRKRAFRTYRLDMDRQELIFDNSDEGEKILNKKAVYEPTSTQRCRQLVCSQRWAVVILITTALVLILIALIAAFARPHSPVCKVQAGSSAEEESSTTGESQEHKVKTFISADGRPFPWHDIRLDRKVVPESYSLFLHPNITQSVFKGVVRIYCSVTAATDFITFHTKDLNITKVTVLRGEVAVDVVDRLEYKDNEQYYVRLAQTLADDSRITLVVEYSGALVSKLSGFYKSKYTAAAGDIREIATTHFEPTDARAAFPCFDEPDLKANFSLSIVRESRHITLFNMPLKTTEPYKGGLLLDQYETSVKMSTYLVAFVVCDFKNISGHTASNKLVRVFTPAEQIDQAHYALEVAVKVLDHYETYFGVPYPLPKQDMIAIPDFAAGAMENWGLITYRLTSILYDPQKTSPSSKQWITIVIAHELAHQWFGNIVTMKWWDDLWLNEGFASYVEYIGAGIAEPNFGMDDQFVYETLQRALYLDSFTQSHPIQATVNDPAEINEIFDKISYAKGASVIAMLEDFTGSERFKEGLHDYLVTHAYGNAQTADLWQAIQKFSSLGEGMMVKDVMDTWTLQMGYPVVTVRRKEGTTDELILTQNRFLLLGSAAETEDPKFKSPFGYQWKIPFTYVTGSAPRDKKLVWLTNKEMTITVPLGLTEWVKGNVGSRGYYRVNYDESLWQLIIQQLKKNINAFSVRDRAQLLDDAFSLARAGLLNYSVAFELFSYFDQEVAYAAIATAFDHTVFIEQRIDVTDAYPTLKKYILAKISGRVHALRWQQLPSHLESLVQLKLLSYAVHLEDKFAVEEGKQLFLNWTGIPTNLRSLVYNLGVKYGIDEVWLGMRDNYTGSTVPTEKKQFLNSLTYTQQPRRIQLLLKAALNESFVRSQDLDAVMVGLANNDVAHIFTWRFLQQHWQLFLDRYGATSFILGNILKGILTPFNTQFDYDEVSAFFKGKATGSGNMALKQALETIKTHIDWTAKYQQTVTDWLNLNSSQL